MNEALRQTSLLPEMKITDSLTARLLEPTDAPAMFRIMQAAPNIHSYITWVAGKESEADVRRAIEEFQQNGESRYALFEEGETEAIGYIGAFKSPDIANEYEFGYFLAPDKRGSGHIFATMNKLMEEAKVKLGAESFALYIQDQNLLSQKVAERLGFNRTEELRKDVVLRRTECRYEKSA